MEGMITTNINVDTTPTTTELYVSPNVTAVNVTGGVNAYEWRFILPPYLLIFVLSVTGNGLVIATLASNRRMRTVTNVYLLNLAISDFLLGVFCLPFTLVGQMYRRFLFGAVLCKLIPYVQAVSVSVVVWTLVAISLERYFAICRLLKSRKWQTRCHAYKMIATVWLASLLFNSPILFVSTLQPMKNDAFKCRENWSSPEMEKTFNLALDAALLLVPIFTMTVAYSMIVHKLWRGMRYEIQHNYNWQRQLTMNNTQTITTATTADETAGIFKENDWTVSNNKDSDGREVTEQQSCCLRDMDLEFRHVVRSTHTDKSIEAKRKVIRMLFVIVLEFFVCWTPLHLINTIYLFYPDELYRYIGPKGVVLLQLLAYCSSCCNPITYCFMNRKFRQAFINLLRTCPLTRRCFRKNSVDLKVATPPPSSQDVTVCVAKGSHSARSETGGLEGEECV